MNDRWNCSWKIEPKLFYLFMGVYDSIPNDRRLFIGCEITFRKSADNNWKKNPYYTAFRRIYKRSWLIKCNDEQNIQCDKINNEAITHHTCSQYKQQNRQHMQHSPYKFSHLSWALANFFSYYLLCNTESTLVSHVRALRWKIWNFWIFLKISQLNLWKNGNFTSFISSKWSIRLKDFVFKFSSESMFL